MLGVAALHAAGNVRRRESGALRLGARVGARRLDVGHQVSAARNKQPYQRPTFPRPLRSRQDYPADPVRRTPGEDGASIGQERPCTQTCTRWSLAVLVAVPESLPTCRRGAGAPLVMARTMLKVGTPQNRCRSRSEVLRPVETAEIECRFEAERDAFRIHDRAAPWRRANHCRRMAPTPLPRHLRDHRGYCRVVQPTPQPPGDRRLRCRRVEAIHRRHRRICRNKCPICPPGSQIVPSGGAREWYAWTVATRC